MDRVLLVIIPLILILLLLSISSLRIRLSYRREGNDDRLSIVLSLWHGILSYKIAVPIVKTGIQPRPQSRYRSWWPRIFEPAFKMETRVKSSNAPERTGETIKDMIGLPRLLAVIKKSKLIYNKYMPATSFFLNNLHLRRFQWHTELGTDEPHITGFLSGVAWSVKGLFISMLYHTIHAGAARPVVSVTPYFEKSCFATRLDCEFDIKLGNVFLTGIKLLFIKIRGL
ncbi:MAG: DUF2953 domain-containing protein [Pelotomaculum sp.]